MKFALRDLQEFLDDAVSRSMASDVLPACQQVCQQYRNFLLLESAAIGAGEDGALGLISPARLRQATVTTQGRRNYVTGKATLTNLPDPGSS